VRVIDRPAYLGPDELFGLPLLVLALPWIARSGLMAHLGISAADKGQVYEELEIRLTELVNEWLENAVPDLPVVLTAHASVQGAKYGGERTVMLGSDLVLSGSLVRDPRLDYVALGHIHKPQNLNEGAHPPVIYPGSIERVDFGEVEDDKYFVIARVERGETEVEWRQLVGIRPFFDRFLQLDSQEGINDQLRSALPDPEKMQDAIVRLVLEYPRDWESMIDDASLREYAAGAFEFHLVKRPQMETRIRLPEDQALGSLTPLELLEKFWDASHVSLDESESLLKLAGEIIQITNGE
jgi:exonuclease SbcD